MDDFSRRMLASGLKRDMTADCLMDVVQERIDATDMSKVAAKDRTLLLSYNGSRLCVGLQRFPGESKEKLLRR